MLSSAPPSLALCAAAQQATGLSTWRHAALALLAAELRFERAMFHAFSPRVDLDTGAFVNIDMNALQRMRGRWDDHAVTFERLYKTAMAQDGVASEREAFGASGRIRTRWNQSVARPLKIRSALAAHLCLADKIFAVVLLGRTRDPEFAQRDRKRLAALVPTLAVCDGLHVARHAQALGGLSTEPRCVDGRLTPRQREVMEHVVLGMTNAEIGAALDISPHTVRNLLVGVRRRLGAANRADVVHRCVFA